MTSSAARALIKGGAKTGAGALSALKKTTKASSKVAKKFAKSGAKAAKSGAKRSR